MPWSPAPFILIAGGVHANRDIGGLRMQMHEYLRLAPGKSLLVIADIMHCHPGKMGQMLGRDGLRAAGLAGQDDAVGGHQRFTRHARIGIGGQIGIDDGIGNPVRNLVRMTFRDRFGREQKLTSIAHPQLP